MLARIAVSVIDSVDDNIKDSFNVDNVINNVYGYFHLEPAIFSITTLTQPHAFIRNLLQICE